jgi:hypothetical protein
MLGATFFHDTIRKYVILFGTLFNSIYINRTNSAGETVQTMKVPLAYGPKEKFLVRNTQDPNLNKPVQIQLPRMGFEIRDIKYSPNRKLQTVQKNFKVLTNEPNKLQYQYVPVPYDITFNLYVMTRFAEDGSRIVEQILPFFTPDWTSTVNLIPSMSIAMDIPIVLDNVTLNDSYEGKIEEDRVIIWTLSFTLKGYIFGPVKKSKVIKFANTNFYIPTTNTAAEGVGNTDPTLRIEVRPGLTANGQPTSNAAASVDYIEIDASEDYGYIITKTDLP